MSCIEATMLSEATASLSINQYISGGTGGRGGEGFHQGHGGSGGRGEGTTVNYNIIAGKLNMNNQDMEQSERKTIIEWLSPLNFFQRQDDIFSTRQEGTGEWLLKKKEFNRWESSVGGVLWCRGIPGVGKTVLASMVVNYLTTKYQPTSNTGVACIYLNHKETGVQTPCNLLSGLWSQLVHDKPLGSLAYNTHAEHNKKRTRASMAQVRALLHDAIGQWSKVYIVVDALDEYPEDDRRILLNDLASCATVNLMVMSRPHIQLLGRFENLDAIDICTDPGDICEYIDARTRNSTRLSSHLKSRPELRDEIHSKITDSGADMFLLVKLQIESLCEIGTIKGVREALNNLPQDLEHTYDSAMQRIGNQNKEDERIAHLALKWVINAKRPLTVEELREALAIVPGSTKWEEDSLLDIEVILSVCAGLIITDTVVPTVRLVHYTAQDYLNAVIADQFPTAQADIAHTLLTLLTFKQFSPDLLQSEWYNDSKGPIHYSGLGHALLDYAQYCLVHAAGEPETLLREIILKFLGQAQAWNQSMRWRSQWNSTHPWDYEGWPENATPLWVAAAANLVETAKYLMTHPMFRGKKLQDISKAVDVASSYGHLGMVKCLTNNYGIWWKALHAVSHVIGYNKAPFCDGLQAASVKGHLDVVQVLIRRGANVNAQDKYGESRLHAASWNGHLDIVQVLIQNGANVNAQDRYGRTVLQAASQNGHLDIVQVLIKKSANVNAQDKYGRTVLQAASQNGHSDIVRVLIEKSANLNAEDRDGRTLLQTASQDGHLDIVHVLIDNGANVNAQDTYNRGALQAASSHGHLDIVRLLIKKGANVNAQDKDGCTVLWAAYQNGYFDIVEILIENGANVNVQAKDGESMLHTASSHGHFNIVQVLIKNGANVNAQDKCGGSVLSAASKKGHLDIVQVLIENSANVNAQDHYGCTVLCAASRNGHRDIVHVLIENGANVKGQDEGYDIPL